MGKRVSPENNNNKVEHGGVQRGVQHEQSDDYMIIDTTMNINLDNKPQMKLSNKPQMKM